MLDITLQANFPSIVFEKSRIGRVTSTKGQVSHGEVYLLPKIEGDCQARRVSLL